MMTLKHNVRRHGGFSLGYAVPMSMLLLFSSLAYLKWQVSAKETAIHQVAVTQAYYVAQAAVISVPMAFMRNARPNFSPTADIHFPDGRFDGVQGRGYERFRYESPKISYITRAGYQAGSLFQRRDYLLEATGVVKVYGPTVGRPVQYEIKRKARLLIRKKEFSQYFYFTDQEQTRFGEFIWFWSRDRIMSPVHANSDIGVHTGAYFGALVTTTGRIFSPEGSTFAGVPRPGYFEHVKEIPIPVRADKLREGAASGGTWLNTNDNEYVYGLWFHGSGATMYRWRTGARPTFLQIGGAVGELTWPTSSEYAIFCDGTLWISGRTSGKLGIGANGNVRLMSDVVLADNTTSFNYPYTVTLAMSSMNTIISEAAEPSASDRAAPWTGILIANTPENGRENGIANNAAPGNQLRRDIAIQAQLFALNSSFTFEDQNDGWDAYQSPTNPDERGAIYLTGAVCQHRRGYVHRSNGGGTGYDKVYEFDPRWDKKRSPVVQYPPFQMDLTSEGFLKWDVIGWQDIDRTDNDQINSRRIRN